MKNIVYSVLITFILCSCAGSKTTTSGNSGTRAQLFDDETFVITKISKDPKYGFTPEKAVMVGGVKDSEGPKNERRYLNALAGPNGEEISYFRSGSCCTVKSENGFGGYGMLDNYKVSWTGAKDTVSIYINMYDFGELKAPVGFTLKNGGN
ncbi:MAG: 2-dehydro-3-deoxyphosphooctonate aldolase [bacterium]|nr:2-dehydro-3-deoxyphosphooctonate aldolase [bacterium]